MTRHRVSRCLLACFLAMTTLSSLLLARPLPAHATVYHSPPQAHSFDYFWDWNGPRHYTIDAAGVTADRVGWAGYNSNHWLNENPGTLGYYMLQSAVWSIYTHGTPYFVQGFSSDL